MGRWKGSPQGPYYDPNDDGPDQVAPPPGMGQNGQPIAQQAAPQQPGGIDLGRGPVMPWSESMPDGMGGSYNPGGHVDANGNPIPSTPPDISGWPRKQYPGGIGGPMDPSMSFPGQGQKANLGVLIGNMGGNGGQQMPVYQATDQGAYGGVMPSLGATGTVPKKPSTLSALGGMLGSAANIFKPRF